MNVDAASPVDTAQGLSPEERDLRLASALVRTALSSEQTLMSWVRTSLSLSTFGFSIAKFFQYLAGDSSPALVASSRRLGLTLISVGVIALVTAMLQHVARVRSLKKQGLPPDSRSFLPFGSAAVMLVIGLAALVGVFLGWQL